MHDARLPSLPLPPPQSQTHQAYSSVASSPRLSAISPASSSLAGSHSSYTSAAPSIGGPKSPLDLSSPLPPASITTGAPSISGQPVHHAVAGYEHYPAMNAGGPTAEMYYQQHMATTAAPQPQSVASHYAPQPPHLLQSGPAQYPPSPYYHQYGANGMQSPTGNPTVSGPMGSQNVLPALSGISASQMTAGQYTTSGVFDTTGQVAPAGMKPRVTATLWEDEGSLCFQVEARGICVARREDNHMINGTKLLNVAGMTRGRRDGILKSEKIRHVVKIGPMHLKGVWIPYERALDFANKEKITELLYPLFVHNIGALLYHPTNQSRTNQVMQAAEQRRKQEQMRSQAVPPPTGSLPSMPHHHSMTLPGPPQQLPSHGNMGRPPLDRAHTFPTPPTSASSVMPNMGPSDNYQWGQPHMNSSQGAGQITIDTSLSSTRGVPATPVTTPPGTGVPSLQSYSSVSQAYDGSRSMYSGAHHASSYPPTTASQERTMYGQSPYIKNEMAPPSSRPAGNGADGVESKPQNGLMHPTTNGESVAPSAGEDDTEHEHDPEYTHEGASYDASRGYSYNAPPTSSLGNDHNNIAPDLAGSPHHPASGRATPRTAGPPAPYYAQPGYQSPPRVGPPASNLFSVMSNDRASTNGPVSGAEVYGAQPELSGSLQNGYPSQAPVLNGNTTSSLKRAREEDDDRPSSSGPAMGMDLKRRKTMESSIPSPYASQPLAQTSPAIPVSRRR